VEAGLNVKGMITWYKTNPGPQIEHVTFRNSCEHILFFIKGKSGHTFNWQGENEMHDHIAAPICLGKERLVDAKGEVLHPTQKPISVLKHLMQISSNRGDTVFDGFSGVGSTGAAAKELKRKFIGIEKDATYFAAMQRRLAGE
jgi:site-specific DNA-methyltransferase (adenine-specific)/modification methylase